MDFRTSKERELQINSSDDKNESREEISLSKSGRKKIEREHAAVLFPEFFPLDGVVCSRRED